MSAVLLSIRLKRFTASLQDLYLSQIEPSAISIISLYLSLAKVFPLTPLFQRLTLPLPIAPQIIFQRLSSLLGEELLSLNAILKTLSRISQSLLPTNSYQVLSRTKQYILNTAFPLVQLLRPSFLIFLQKPYIRFLNIAFT